MWISILRKIMTHNSKRREYLPTVDFKVQQTCFNGERSLLATTTKQTGYSFCFEYRTAYVSSLHRLIPVHGQICSCRFIFTVYHKMIWFHYPMTTELMYICVYQAFKNTTSKKMLLFKLVHVHVFKGKLHRILKSSWLPIPKEIFANWKSSVA